MTGGAIQTCGTGQMGLPEYVGMVSPVSAVLTVSCTEFIGIVLGYYPLAYHDRKDHYVVTMGMRRAGG